MNGDLKLSFMQRTANEYMQRVMRDMGTAALRNKVGITGEGIASLSYQSALQGASVSASLSFREYLRFVDMGVGRGHPLGGLKAVRVNLQASNRVGNKFVKDNTFKPKKIYSKIAYGNLTYMYNKLLYGFTEETIAELKLELQQNNNQENV